MVLICSAVKAVRGLLPDGGEAGEEAGERSEGGGEAGEGERTPSLS